MLNDHPKFRHFGLTLVELMVGVAILSILLAVAMPSFKETMRNMETRNAAEAVTGGLQRARGEAVARNTSVAFVLGTDSSWTISEVASGTVIESRSSNEGSQNTTRTVSPVGTTTFTFGSLGTRVTNADSSASLAQIDLATSGGTRPLRVTIGVGGNARMCDPNLTSGSSPAAC